MKISSISLFIIAVQKEIKNLSSKVDIHSLKTMINNKIRFCFKLMIKIDDIFEEIYPSQINLKSFEEKESLNPRIWNEDGSLKAIIRKRLYEIAKDFIDNIDEMDIHIEDVLLVGSIAGYNWSKYSDIDCHIVVDYDALKEYASKEILQRTFDQTKDAWNKKHNLLLYGYPVELYVQDVRSGNESDGIYSIKYGKWVKFPKGGNELQQRELIKRQAAAYLNLIDKYSKMAYECHSKKAAEIITHEIEKLYDESIRSRKEALAEGGEYAPGNIVFKVLRRTGAIQKMKDAKTLLYDKINAL
jgi:hypothetical protein